MKSLDKKYFTRLVCLLTVVAVILASQAAVFKRAINVFAGRDRLVPIYRVQTDEKRIAISFDAAWGSDKTPKLLEILKKYDIKTTFFLVKMWMDKYPDMTKLIAQEGHEIGNHSATHPRMGSLSRQEIIEEIKTTHEKIKELTGQECRVFRPPFGDYSNTLITTANELGYYVIQWDVDSLDWKDLSAGAIYSRVVNQVKPGSIILFHNNGKNTAEALEPILKELKGRGYEIVPVSQLLIKGDYYVDRNTGEMRKKQ
ncbi:polysaccharide deacetylase family protein [Thermosediminibacter litoriperuensis]|uniref:Polysaccharide deacetylase family sporulation protein PdaB n=1 Tax=Thermosediminibacter litoriperuensis TaxID=291989 RepID=A0A5S5AV31_9FIRM|nr:polysaccharide deacetylase family protein [Thermosediminibacter litoriperuensis]TYP56756.1 polysaccharide deacetylase family sporulation protein PdaB [Thermosediminibacter litoriperuensis]